MVAGPDPDSISLGEHWCLLMSNVPGVLPGVYICLQRACSMNRSLELASMPEIATQGLILFLLIQVCLCKG